MFENFFPNGYNRQRRNDIPKVTVLIIVVNAIVFLYTDLIAFMSNDIIVSRYAMDWQMVLEHGEWYRLLTSIFLHSGIEHLGSNMLILGYMGYCVEHEIGSLRFGILYFGTGILAGCTSMVYNMLQNGYVISVGASGAIFGIVGGVLFLVLFSKTVYTQYTIQQVALMAFLSLYSGFVNQEVDNAAHVGGFLAGFVLMGILSLTFSKRENTKNYR